MASGEDAGGRRHNLEVKARVDGATLTDVRERLAAASLTPLTLLTQVDTYFTVKRGRLKLRESVAEDGATRSELIAYARPDADGLRWSAYRRVPLTAAAAEGIKAALGETAGVLVVVEKRRAVGTVRRTRVHLDAVRGLGTFIELETVVERGPAADADDELRAVAKLIGLDLARVEVIAGSYSDLLISDDEAAMRVMEGENR